MGFYVRFIVADARGLSVEVADLALASALPDSRSVETSAQARDVYFGGRAFWELEVLEAGSDLFSSEQAELIESMPTSDDEAAVNRVRETLDRATAILILRVLQPGRDSSDAHDKLDALWSWLLVNRTGLICSDDGPHFFGEGLEFVL